MGSLVYSSPNKFSVSALENTAIECKNTTFLHPCMFETPPDENVIGPDVPAVAQDIL
jgi:hypothetical protein